MNIDLALVCDYAIVDHYGKLSVMGIFEHLWIAKFPAVHPRVHLVIRLKGRRTEVGQHQVRIRLLDPDDEQVLNGDGIVDFAEPPAGVTDIDAGTVLVFDVPVTREGRYRFEISVDGEVQQYVPLKVARTPAQTPPVDGGPPPPID